MNVFKKKQKKIKQPQTKFECVGTFAAGIQPFFHMYALPEFLTGLCKSLDINFIIVLIVESCDGKYHRLFFGTFKNYSYLCSGLA